MTEEELIALRNSVAERLADYAGCSKDSALTVIRLMRGDYSTEGALLYNMSDRLDARGY